MTKLGRNEPCPCGSGKKLKKCCGDPRAAVLYTSIDRQNALEWLNECIDTFAEDEWEDAADDLWGRYLDQADELPPELMQFSQAVEDMWCAFDYIGERGVPLVDIFMAEAELGDGERAFLTALRKSSMRLYEVVDAVPGVSLTLRDVIEGGQVTVNERTGSRMISRHEYVAARVVPRGPSGGPEIEAGLLHMPGLFKDSVAEQLREHRAAFLDEHRGASIDEFYKTMPPFFHDVWVGAFLDPYVPTPKTTDGEDMIPTEVQFDVSDGDAVSRALDDHPEIERNEEIWTWCGKNREGKIITLGTAVLEGPRHGGDHRARISPQGVSQVTRTINPADYGNTASNGPELVSCCHASNCWIVMPRRDAAVIGVAPQPTSQRTRIVPCSSASGVGCSP
jgi:hypothetical protein